MTRRIIHATIIIFMRPIRRYELIELLIPTNSTGTKFQFPDIPLLRDDTTQDIIIRAIDVFTAEAMPNSPSNNPVSTTAQLLNAFLVLYIYNEEAIHYIPLIKLQNVFQALATGTSQQTFEEVQFEDIKVDWNKSYIQFAQPLAPFTQFSFMLGVTYKKYLSGTIPKNYTGYDNVMTPAQLAAAQAQK
jgi:hypothetical protein